MKQEYRALIAYQQADVQGRGMTGSASSRTRAVRCGRARSGAYTSCCGTRSTSNSTYPSPIRTSPPELALPELDGKTKKVYRGGKICLDVHFWPLWAGHAPHFGIVHAIALGLGPWLTAEILALVANGQIKCEDG